MWFLAALLLQPSAETLFDRALAAWFTCAENYAAAASIDRDPSDLIADGALYSCETEEGRYRMARYHYLIGKGLNVRDAEDRARASVTDAKVGLRKHLIVEVQIRRRR